VFAYDFKERLNGISPLVVFLRVQSESDVNLLRQSSAAIFFDLEKLSANQNYYNILLNRKYSIYTIY